MKLIELKKVVEQHLALFQPYVVYLFGTYDGPYERPDSDIDIAFLPERRCDPYEVYSTAQTLAISIGRDVELIDLSSASVVFRKQVVVTGRVLYLRDERRKNEFEMYTLSDYARTNEERQEILQRFDS